MVKTDNLANRILKLVDVAKSRRRFAKIVGNNERTVRLWEEGSTPYNDTVERIAERTGVSLAWLREGRGNDEQEVEKFRERLNERDENVTESSVVREDPSPSEQMDCPLHLPPASGSERTLELAAAQLDSLGTSKLIVSVLKDPQLSKSERMRAARRLAAVLSHKLSDEIEPSRYQS